MVVPLSPTVVPLHPCLAEPPKEVVRDVLPYRLALRCLLGAHIVTVIAILVSPAPYLAFSQVISIFLGVMATHSTMPIRYNLYGILTLFVCVASIVRFVERIPLPEFGYSLDNRILQLAKIIKHLASPEEISKLSDSRLAEFLDKNRTPAVDQFIETNRRVQNTPRLISSSSSMIQTSPLLASSYLQESKKRYGISSRTERVGHQYVLDPSSSSFLESTISQIPSKRVSHRITDFFPLRQDHDLEEFKAVIGSSFLQTPKKTYDRITVEDIQEYIHLQPAQWRSTLEMIAVGATSVVTAFATILAFICGRKIEKQVNRSIAEALGLNSDSQVGTTAPLLPSTVFEPPREPYLHDPMGERAIAYRPFTGPEITLESWMSQEGHQATSSPQQEAAENVVSSNTQATMEENVLQQTDVSQKND